MESTQTLRTAARDRGFRAAAVNRERILLPAEPRSVPVGRHFLEQVLERWTLTDLSDVATLLASEALTNAVVHAGTPVLLDICADHELLVRVTDRDPTFVMAGNAAPGSDLLSTAAEAHAEGGRGLALISILADRWGIDSGTTGKTVWFALDAAAPAKL